MRSSIPKWHWLVLLFLAVVTALHQYQVWGWFIEDSAITFSYARHLAAGEGLVPWPGGERIEAVSNPTWTILIALGELVGLTGFDTAKPMSLCFSWLTLWLVYRLAGRAIPEDGSGHWALLAPFFLATGSVYNMWASSGLENALFGAVMTGAVLRMVKELDDGGAPWSSGLFFLLAITRPEGLLYAAVAGFWMLFHTWRTQGSYAHVAKWVVGFWGPFGLFLAARLAYFAWPLPMTYYGKIGTGGTVMYKWDGRGWNLVRDFAANTWAGWIAPIYLLGLLGRTRLKWAGILAATYVLAFAIPGPDVVQGLPFWPDLPAPDIWLRLRILVLVVGVMALPAWGRTSPGGTARMLTWAMSGTILLFAVYSNGDWMRGYRWMSLHGPTSAVLLAAATYEIARAAQDWTPATKPATVSALTASLLAGLTLPPNISNTEWFASEGKNETPMVIHRRVKFTRYLGRKLHLDEQLRNMDMDMGAFLWFSRQALVDMAGLVDVPIAVHTYADRTFIEEYMFREQRPHTVHCHGHWERTAEFRRYTLFRRDWFEIPPWKDGKVRWHPGEFVRRDLVFSPSWEGDLDRRVDFAGGASLQGWRVPHRKISRGRAFYIETGWKTWKRKPGEDFNVVAFVSNGKQQAVWDLPMAYDWLTMDKWRPDETFMGRYSLELPGHLEPGVYDLGFAVTGPKGINLPAGGWNNEARVAPGAKAFRGPKAQFTRGEVRFFKAIEVVKYAHADELALGLLDKALEHAGANRCDQAEAAWLRARRAVPKNYGWQEQTHDEQVGPALSGCWSRMALAVPEQAVDHLKKAHDWDHNHPTFLEVSRPVAQSLYDKGLEARDRGDAETAYHYFTETLAIQPTRSWARRYAEEARNARLGLEPVKILGRMKRREKTETPP